MSKEKTSGTTPEVTEVLAMIEEARKLLSEWAAVQQIDLLRVEPVTPAINLNKAFSVWLFFNTDKQLKEYEAKGTLQQLKDRFVNSLRELNCPEDYLQGIIFFPDTQENVKRFDGLKPIQIG
jgi:hypothetical protein